MFPDRFEDKELEDVGCPTCGDNAEKKNLFINIEIFVFFVASLVILTMPLQGWLKKNS